MPYLCILGVQGIHINLRIVLMPSMLESVLTSTMRISEETKKELLKVGGELTAKDGVERTLEEIVKLLLSEHSERKKTK